jgi:hypothetical protein
MRQLLRPAFLQPARLAGSIYHAVGAVTFTAFEKTIRLRPKYPNHIWSVNFVHYKLSNGRPYKMPTVLEEYTRQALCVEVRPRMGTAEVLEALYPRCEFKLPSNTGSVIAKF